MSLKFSEITSLEQLDRLFEDSVSAAVVIFKHSNACGTSAYINEIIGSLPGTVHRVIVQENRDVSNEIARRTGVIHHTPQVFVLKNGRVVYSASHYGISPEKIATELS